MIKPAPGEQIGIIRRSPTGAGVVFDFDWDKTDGLCEDRRQTHLLLATLRDTASKLGVRYFGMYQHKGIGVL